MKRLTERILEYLLLAILSAAMGAAYFYAV